MNTFIKKLFRKGNIKITEPSNDICQSYLAKSEKSLISSKTLIRIGHYDDATALIYYSMYYATLALLFKTGIKSENHTGTIMLLKELYDIDNKKILDAKKERIDKQYYIDFKATVQEVKEGIIIAEEFNSIIKQRIDTIKETELKDILRQFRKKRR